MHRVVALALGIALGLAACGGEPAGPPAAGTCAPRGILRDGDPLPNCSFRSFDGGTLALRELRGTPVVLNFWASWCPPCIKEMPMLQRVHRSLDDGVTFVGMNMLGVKNQTEAAARTTVDETGARYRLAFDEGGMLYSHFGTSLLRPVMPVTVFVDEDGVVRHTVFGELTESDLRSAIRTALGVS